MTEDTHKPSRDIIVRDLINVVIPQISGCDMQYEPNIDPQTFLGADLHMKSLDFIRLLNAIKQHFNRDDFPFHNLLIAPDGSMLNDITIEYIAEFIDECICTDC